MSLHGTNEVKFINEQEWEDYLRFEFELAAYEMSKEPDEVLLEALFAEMEIENKET